MNATDDESFILLDSKNLPQQIKELESTSIVTVDFGGVKFKTNAISGDKHLQTISFIGFSPSLFKSHCLKIGGASHYASLGYSDAQIQLFGHWKSDAFKSTFV